MVCRAKRDQTAAVRGNGAGCERRLFFDRLHRHSYPSIPVIRGAWPRGGKAPLIDSLYCEGANETVWINVVEFVSSCGRLRRLECCHHSADGAALPFHPLV